MDHLLREQIYKNLDLRDTEELLEILRENDSEEWDDEAFDIIKEILRERLGKVPTYSAQTKYNRIIRKIEIHREAGDLKKALSECKSAIKLVPDDARAFNYRGLIYDEMGQLEKAKNDYLEAIHLDPELEDAVDNLNIVEAELEDDFLHSTIKEHLDRALEFVNNGEPEKALKECKLARPNLPNIALAFNYLGLILETLDQLESAVNAYFEAVRLNPHFFAARENLANARVKLEEDHYRRPPIGKLNLPKMKAMSFGNGDPVPGWVYMDEPAILLAGWPGHRTRPGRTGYDPLDTPFEEAHIEGVVIRMILIGRFRTHNPIYLLIMIFIGLIFCTPLFLGVISAFAGDVQSIIILSGTILDWIIGLALLTNVFLSLLVNKPIASDNKGNEFF
jgi:tetratricopeptide (TPR) repeat protein